MAAKILTILLGLTLVLAVACGGAPAAPEPTATQVADTAQAAEPTAAPVVGETAQPTATPQAVAPPAEVEVNPGKLTIMIGDLGNERFDRALGSGVGNNFGRIVHGFLISTNERKKMVPGIASQWGLSDDGLTWTFTIREGVKWHDGSELTPEDVLWSLQHIIDPQSVEYVTYSTAQSIARRMERIELSEPDKVSLTSKVPVTELAFYISEAGPEWWPIMPRRAKLHDTEEEAAYDSNPVGAGFMSLQEHVPASVMRFENFDDYYYQPDNGFPIDKRVKFRSLDMYLVPEEVTRVAALRSGEADIIPASLSTKQQVEAGGGRLVFGQETVYPYLQFIGCWTDPSFPCADKRVRQALHYTINKELIGDLFGGPQVFQAKGWAFVTPSTVGYTPALDPWPFDPDKARQLLADAGYPGGEGFGKLIVNTWRSTSTPYLVEGAQLVADMWRRELGLDVEVRVGDSVGLGEMEDAGELNGQGLWRDNETRGDATNSIASDYGDTQAPDRDHNDPEIFRLVQEALGILDPGERAEAYKKLYPRLREESYRLGVGYVNIPWGVGPRVLTWEPDPLSQYVSAFHTITLK